MDQAHHHCSPLSKKGPETSMSLYLGTAITHLVTFGGYATIHFMLATLQQPIYFWVHEKMHLFAVSPGVHTTQKVTSWQSWYKKTGCPTISLLLQKLKGKQITDSSVIHAIRWHAGCCQITGSACPPTERLSWACPKLEFLGRHECRALEYLDMMEEDPDTIRKPVPKDARCQAPRHQPL